MKKLLVSLSTLFVLLFSGCGGGGSIEWNDPSDPGDTTPPSVPTNATAEALTPGSIKLAWNASTDNEGILYYKIYHDGIYKATAHDTTYTVGGLSPETQYCYTVTAIDWSENESGHSVNTCATTPVDTLSPTAPSNVFTYYQLLNDQPTFSISWSSSSDDGTLAGYKVFRNGTYIGSTSQTQYSDSSIDAMTTYCYTVLAYDMANNESNISDSFCATSSWRLERIKNGQYGSYNYPSIDADSEGVAHVSYNEFTFDTNTLEMIRDVYYTNNENGIWDPWTEQKIDTLIYPNYLNGDRFTPIKIDSNYNIHVGYSMNNLTTQDGLKYWNNSIGVVETIDNSHYIKSSDLDIDSDNKVHFSYHHNNSYKYATNKSGTWVIETVEALAVIAPGTSSISIDSNGFAHIAYYDYGNSDLKYATNKSGTWVIEPIDTAGNVGEYPSLALDSSGYVHISYHDVSNAVLKYTTNKSGSWVNTTFSAASQNSEYSSIALDTLDKVHIAYTGNSDLDNNLYEYSNFSGSWKTYIIDDFLTSYRPEITIDADNYTHIVYKRSGDIKYATNRP